MMTAWRAAVILEKPHGSNARKLIQVRTLEAVCRFMSVLESTPSANIALPVKRLRSRHLTKVDKPAVAIQY